MASINDLVLAIVNENPRLSNEEVAAEVQRRVPGSTTSAASVSSIKSKAKKAGLMSSAGAVAMDTSSPAFLPEELPAETQEERSKRIRTRYNTLERMAHRVAGGHLPALIVSGPPGLGKSYTVEQVLETTKDPEEYDIICGTITAVGLYIALWEMRDGGVVVLDDCDDVFRDETCLNLLKAVLDSSSRRIVSYRKRAHWMEEMDIPTSFEFNGSVVFCTNIDFEAAIRKGSAMGAHFEALIDRSLYLSLTMRTHEDFITRIRHVAIEDGLLVSVGLSEEQADEVMQYVIDHTDRFYGLSLRLITQIAKCYLADPVNWKDDVEATKMRTI
ncbi:ATP-binding protein [Brucella abortus]|nr:ATP-binding protein [Brucella abortus]